MPALDLELPAGLHKASANRNHVAPTATVFHEADTLTPSAFLERARANPAP
jgi:hypothetical protein